MPSFKNSLKLPKNLINLVPTSFDQIGEIAIFNEFPKELKKNKKFSGKYRLQKIRIIAGKKTKETIHKENNLKFKLDIEKAYFSPRTGSERLRIASKIKPDESVLV